MSAKQSRKQKQQIEKIELIEEKTNRFEVLIKNSRNLSVEEQDNLVFAIKFLVHIFKTKYKTILGDI